MMVAMLMKPSGRSSYAGLLPAGRKKVELLIITQMPPFFASKATRGRAPHIVALLGSTFHVAARLCRFVCRRKIERISETSKCFGEKVLSFYNLSLGISK